MASDQRQQVRISPRSEEASNVIQTGSNLPQKQHKDIFLQLIADILLGVGVNTDRQSYNQRYSC